MLWGRMRTHRSRDDRVTRRLACAEAERLQDHQPESRYSRMEEVSHAGLRRPANLCKNNLGKSLHAYRRLDGFR